MCVCKFRLFCLRLRFKFNSVSREQHLAGRATWPRLAIVYRVRLFVLYSKFPLILYRTARVRLRRKGRWRRPSPRRKPNQIPIMDDYLLPKWQTNNNKMVERIGRKCVSLLIIVEKLQNNVNNLPKFSSPEKHRGYRMRAIKMLITVIKIQ